MILRDEKKAENTNKKQNFQRKKLNIITMFIIEVFAFENYRMCFWNVRQTLTVHAIWPKNSTLLANSLAFECSSLYY